MNYLFENIIIYCNIDNLSEGWRLENIQIPVRKICNIPHQETRKPWKTFPPLISFSNRPNGNSFKFLPSGQTCVLLRTKTHKIGNEQLELSYKPTLCPLSRWKPNKTPYLLEKSAIDATFVHEKSWLESFWLGSSRDRSSESIECSC